MEFYANLHTHSTHSDGKWTPRELVRIAYEEGYRAMALTDHDTVTGNAEAADECQKLGMENLFGCEFTVKEPYSFHMTAFEFDADEPKMRAYLEKLSRRESEETRLVLEMEQKRGEIRGITWEDVLRHNEGVSWLCNDHVFRTLTEMGLAENKEYDAWFNEHFARQRGVAKKELEKEGFRFLTAKELIDLIHRAGGIAVFAHPMRLIEKVQALLDAGIDGIEVWHADQKQPEAEMSYRVAIENGLYISGGSDHAGLCGGLYGTFPDEKTLKKSEVYIPPFCCGTTKEYFDEIRNRRIERA